MKKMGLMVNNLLRDNTKVSAAEGSFIRVLGFLPVKLWVWHERAATLVSLSTLNALKCLPESLPLQSPKSVSSLTERQKEEYEEEDEEEVKPRQPTPNLPKELPFQATEMNMPKLKAWLTENFSSSRFNTSSAPLAKMTSNPIKIHIDNKADPIA